MALPALKTEPEVAVEGRFARLESDVEYIKDNVSESRKDFRRLEDKVDRQDAKIDAVGKRLDAKIDEVDKRLGAKIDEVDKRLGTKIDEVDKSLSAKIDAVKDSVTAMALQTEKSFAKLNIGRALDKVWWLLMSAAILGVMARGFKWI